jgi:hypothetical protein
MEEGVRVENQDGEAWKMRGGEGPCGILVDLGGSYRKVGGLVRGETFPFGTSSPSQVDDKAMEQHNTAHQSNSEANGIGLRIHSFPF